jgi:AcrR family transcriptional regulator
MPSSRRPAPLRDALLQRAAQTIVSDGVDAVSLRQLARELDVSHAAPARHFRTRADLLNGVAIAGFDQLAAALRDAAAETAGGDPRARLRALADTYLAFATEQGRLLDLMYSRKTADDSAPAVADAGRTSLLPLLEVLDEAVAAGQLPPGDPVSRAQVALSAVHGVSALAGPQGMDGTPPAQILEATLDVLWRGMGGA